MSTGRKTSKRALPRREPRMAMSQLINIAVGDLDPESIPDGDIKEIYHDLTGEVLSRADAATTMLYLATTSWGFAKALRPGTLAQMRFELERYAVERHVQLGLGEIDGAGTAAMDAV